MLISCCCSPHARNSRSSSIWRWKAASIRARPSLNSSGQKGTRGMAGQPCALPCSICVICSLRAPMFLLYLTSALDLDLCILLEACTSARASTHASLTMPEEAHRTLPIGTIKTQLFRARPLLKQRLLAQHLCGLESQELS